MPAVGQLKRLNDLLRITVREGEELKAPRHASAAATRDSNLPHVTATYRM
jgi:hypothetical protein